MWVKPASCKRRQSNSWIVRAIAEPDCIVNSSRALWWSAGCVLLLCLPALVPLAVIALALAAPDTVVWSHLSRYVLPDVAWASLQLVIGVGALSGVLGTSLAWLTSMCEFPGRRFLDWALLLPLAM